MLFRLAIALGLIAALAAPAHAASGDDVCDDGEDVFAALFASISPAPATVAPAGSPVAPPDGDACRGSITDDPSCWPESPTGAPPSGGFAGLGGPEVFVLASAILPGPDSMLAAPVPAPVGTVHPGYARGIDRPPRS